MTIGKLKNIENNIGNISKEECLEFFQLVKGELALDIDFEFTLASPSICLDTKILLYENDIHYPWFTKQTILHEITHHLVPEDKTHGTRFHKKYAELVNRFLAGENERDALINWLIERRRKLQEKKERHLQLNPKDIQSAKIAGIKARALQEVINYLLVTK